MNKPKKSNTIKKELNIPFYAAGSREPITQEEIDRRKRRIERAKQIGSSITTFDGCGEHENPYRAEAMMKYVMQDKDVPAELIKRIREYDIEYEKKRRSKRMRHIKNDLIDVE